MKTQETTNPQMDEIVFEKRNKMYGAYILRKMYNKQINKALLLSIAILIAGLAYPLVSSYNALTKGKHIWIDAGVEVISKAVPAVEPPVIPPAPPSTSEIQKQVRFVPPEVVDGIVPGDEGLLNQDFLNNTLVNEPINLNPDKHIEKQPSVIEDPETAPPVIIVEEMPSYPGGDVERLKFLSAHIQYPVSATENGIQGTVYFQFVVDTKGNITDVKILRGIGGGCDEEALRVIKMMPPWHPGKQNGRTVRVLYNMAVSFKMQ
jgi:protein TonB